MEGALDVSCSIKKAMAIVPKLDVKVVNLGKNLQVLGYTSDFFCKFHSVHR